MKRLPIVMMLFFSVFGFIGLTLLVVMWGGTLDGFGGPPVFFKIFVSFIAAAFMIMGFGVPLSALFASRAAGGAPEDPASPGATPPPPKPSAGYQCPHCGAGLEKQEVSPGGDVKCAYCHKWYNIHRPLG